jgi:hypothetical protein
MNPKSALWQVVVHEREHVVRVDILYWRDHACNIITFLWRNKVLYLDRSFVFSSSPEFSIAQVRGERIAP